MTSQHPDGPERRRPLSPWAALTRTALGADDGGHRYVVVVDFLEPGKNARLYRDDVVVSTKSAPATFAVDGISVEVATTLLGVKRAVLRTATHETPLAPLPETWEYRRLLWGERHPRLDRAIAAASWIVLAAAVLLGAGYLVQWASVVTTQTPLGEALGFGFEFEMPLDLPGSASTAITVVTLLAALDRALRMKYSWWLDSGLGDAID